MKHTRTFVLLLLLGASAAASAQEVGKIGGLEAGYGYISTSHDLDPGAPHALLASLHYGYLIMDRPDSSALLSLAVGVNWFPMAAGDKSLLAIVYGLEYMHVFFRQGSVALAVEYGLLFNLLLEDGRDGYAFGHDTRLGLGPLFRLSEHDELLLLVDYNFVTFPYFEQSSASLSFPSLSLRYQRRF